MKSVGLPEVDEMEGFGGGAPNLGREEEVEVEAELVEVEERRERNAD